jgi:hypothetical protein
MIPSSSSSATSSPASRFTREEERIVATLSYPTEPIPVTATAEISGVDEPTTSRVSADYVVLAKYVSSSSPNAPSSSPQEGEEKYAPVFLTVESEPLSFPQ